jgi:DNA-binding MarR family transcriptional regulator
MSGASPTPATRAPLLTLTAKGHELVEITVPVTRDVETAWEAHLVQARTRQLRNTLAALREITDPYAPPRPRQPRP